MKKPSIPKKASPAYRKIGFLQTFRSEKKKFWNCGLEWKAEVGADEERSQEVARKWHLLPTIRKIWGWGKFYKRHDGG